jgi:hypothetical protein
MKKFKVATYLTAKRGDIAVLMSPKLFQRIEGDLLNLGLAKQLYEMDLEEYRTGKLSADDFRKQIRPNPGALGIPAKDAFAKLRQKIKRRRERHRNHNSRTTKSR